jgi:hypothetical protein
VSLSRFQPALAGELLLETAQTPNDAGCAVIGWDDRIEKFLVVDRQATPLFVGQDDLRIIDGSVLTIVSAAVATLEGWSAGTNEPGAVAA